MPRNAECSNNMIPAVNTKDLQSNKRDLKNNKEAIIKEKGGRNMFSNRSCILNDKIQHL